MTLGTPGTPAIPRHWGRAGKALLWPCLPSGDDSPQGRHHHGLSTAKHQNAVSVSASELPAFGLPLQEYVGES